MKILKNNLSLKYKFYEVKNSKTNDYECIILYFDVF